MKPEPKPLFLERMEKLLGEDFDKYLEVLENPPMKTIRCNTLKIKPEVLKKRLEKKKWKIKQPFDKYPEIMIIENELGPGELGNSVEHLLGYYYVQEISSMLPIIALDPKEGEIVLDLCAAPGSKTSQAAAMMENKGTIIANDVNLGRVKILMTNLNRVGASNVIITRADGIALCSKLKKEGFQVDKILLDVPCSGEGNIRTNPKTNIIWNLNTIRKLSGLQKKIIDSAIGLLKVGGELVYSTCTHSPEENEENVNYILETGEFEIQEIKLPIKCRKGIGSWEGKDFDKEVIKSCRVYPQDNETEGFFIAKFKKVGK